MSNVDEMLAGRELDELVQEWVIGTVAGEDTKALLYSTNMADAWKVLQAIYSMDGDYSYNFAEYLCGGEPVIYPLCEPDGFGMVCFVEDTLKDITPLRICQAALKAVQDGP